MSEGDLSSFEIDLACANRVLNETLKHNRDEIEQAYGIVSNININRHRLYRIKDNGSVIKNLKSLLNNCERSNPLSPLLPFLYVLFGYRPNTLPYTHLRRSSRF
jgi:hypothetical protein